MGECLKESQLIEHMIHHPEACFQGPYDDTNKMAIQECVANIPCNRTNNDVDYNTVMRCSHEGQIICCLEKKDYCQRTKPPTKDKSDCTFIGKERKHHTRNHKNHKNGKCVFPFIYHGKSYYKCTVDGASECFRWCATMVNQNNVYIKNSNLWAYCENKCPVEYGENCRNKTKVPRFKKEKKHKSVNATLSCGTQDTTTSIKNREGNLEDFTLINPGNCVFPFNYRGQWYYNCITKDDPMCRFWCSVRNDHGYHRALGSKWAYCNTDCKNNNKDHSCEGGAKTITSHYYEEEFPTIKYVEREDQNFKFEPEED